MSDAAIKAKEVLEKCGIDGVPALFLRDIAESENIVYRSADYPDDPFDGYLLYKGNKRAIIVNTYGSRLERQNFTFAHELGHYFMKHPPSYTKDGQSGFRCSNEDIENSQKPREVEANCFAAELLMPEEQFRLDMTGADIDFALIGGLANKYMVSKQACCYRLIGFVLLPCAVVFSKNGNITSMAISKAARSYMRNLAVIPEGTTAKVTIDNRSYNKQFIICDANKWLVRATPNGVVYECTHVHAESGAAMTILRW